MAWGQRSQCAYKSVCMRIPCAGLVVGDEILVMNGRVVADLDMVYIENMLADIDTICLTIRSCRTDRPVNTTQLMEHADMYIDSLTCPPPPSQSRISDKVIGELIVPAPNWGKTLINTHLLLLSTSHYSLTLCFFLFSYHYTFTVTLTITHLPLHLPLHI